MRKISKVIMQKQVLKSCIFPCFIEHLQMWQMECIYKSKIITNTCAKINHSVNVQRKKE